MFNSVKVPDLKVFTKYWELLGEEKPLVDRTTYVYEFSQSWLTFLCLRHKTTKLNHGPKYSEERFSCVEYETCKQGKKHGLNVQVTVHEVIVSLYEHDEMLCRFAFNPHTFEEKEFGTIGNRSLI